MENETNTKRNTNPSMIKWGAHIVFLFIFFNGFAQPSDAKQKMWEKEAKNLEYPKQRNYKGPKDWNGGYPTEMSEEYVYVPPKNSRTNPRRTFSQGGGVDSEGTFPTDPPIERLSPTELPDIELPEVDFPDVDFPDVDFPDVNPPSWSETFWKLILYLIIGALLIFVAYLIFKHRNRLNQKVTSKVNIENDWNPEEITKTELELKLEQAEAEKDYRSCVRIYFTFILKSLIQHRWIQWKKEKTNHHYVLEMQKQPSRSEFEKCVRIYELVWYGDYQIDGEVYQKLLPTLQNYYHSVKNFQ